MNINQIVKDNLNAFSDKFPSWISDNPHIWQEFERRALKVAERGYTHFSSKCLFEVIRYHTALKEKDPTFKLNNNYTGDMARLFMLVHPRLDGFFETRNRAA